ncbi:MAG TPA: dihydropteroate synthase [Patescibacteria group bacterium]|nr:dihydropteroate synthase [Patescibacteria group bacterium]
MTDTVRGPFIVIGENIHATRVLLRSGARVASLPDGRPALPFTDDDGAARLLPVPGAALDGAGEKQKVKHVKAAVLAGLAGGADAELGRGYVRFLARRQVEAGADYLDLNVDETSNDVDGRVAAIRWLVGAVEDATPAAVALDSSAPEVLRAGLAATTRSAGAPLLNSASLERLDVLDLAAAEGCAVVLGASGERGMPASAAERVANATRVVDEAIRRGMALSALHVDPLVMPVAVEPEVGAWFLEAVRTLRATLGPEVHLTGGLSNVSFGLPLRKLLNDVFIDLAAEAGADSGIIDPVASDLHRIFAQERAGRAATLAADLLTGRDPFGMAFLTAYRAGELA